MSEKNSGVTHAVVVNAAEQYSIWPAHRRPPAGWSSVGEPGSRDHCLGVISQNWTDMRPLALRSDGAAATRPATSTSTSTGNAL